ncbi:metalloregulator ArsR/SmtB family transcription factor [soil metagenome]
MHVTLLDPALLSALANPRRRAILGLVWDRELSAGEIARHFPVSWPAISQNLGVLRRAGIVTERRVGTRRLYRADQAALGPLAEVIAAMWAADLERLGRLAEADEAGPSTDTRR